MHKRDNPMPARPSAPPLPHPPVCDQASAPTPSPSGRSHRPSAARIAEFLEQLRQGVPVGHHWEDPLNLLSLMLSHPKPPTVFSEAVRCLREAMRLSAPAKRAHMLRQAATALHISLPKHRRSWELGYLLHRAALDLDDRPEHRIRLANLAACCGRLPALRYGDTLPRVEPPTNEAEPSCAPHIAQDIGQEHCHAICMQALQEVGKAGKAAFKAWSPTDLEAALLALRYLYVNTTLVLSGATPSRTGAEQDFMAVGLPLWDRLKQALRARPGPPPKFSRDKQAVLNGTGADDLLGAEPLDENWHRSAQGAVLLALKRIKPNAAPFAPSATALSGPSAAALSGPSLVVCTRPIPPSQDKYDKEVIDSHKALESTLPLAPMPTPAALLALQRDLQGQMPWAAPVLAVIFDDLRGRAQLGASRLGMPATLLVGEPGSGKSHLAKRIAAALGLPILDIALGGLGDSKQLAGTARGWATGKPGDIPTLMASRGSASVMVLLDELDKACEAARNDSGIQGYLLALLEPETARRHSDCFLKTECDLSGVLWLATANHLSPLSGPMRSRLRVLRLAQPAPAHFQVVASNVLGEMAQSWGVDRWALPQLDALALPWQRLSSARQVRQATEQAATAWACQLQRH